MLNIEKITQLRKNCGWEQGELAQIANVNPSVISRLERGLQDDFKLSVIVKIANALDVPVDDLLDKSDTENPYELSPELNSAINRLRRHSLIVQNRIAGMISGYLAILESET